MPGSALLPGAQHCLSLMWHGCGWLDKVPEPGKEVPSFGWDWPGLPCKHRAKPSRNRPQKGPRYSCPRPEGQEPPKVIPQMHPTTLPCPLAHAVVSVPVCLCQTRMTRQGWAVTALQPVPDLPQAKTDPI